MNEIILSSDFEDYSSIRPEKNDLFPKEILLNNGIEGCLKTMRLDDGAIIIIWNFRVQKPITFRKQTAEQPGKEYLILDYFLLSGTAQLQLGWSGSPHTIIGPVNENVLLNGNSPHAMTYRPGDKAKGLSILITYDWLKQQFFNAGILPDLEWIQEIENYSKHKNTALETAYIKRLFDDIDKENSILSIKAYFYNLLYHKLPEISIGKASKPEDKEYANETMFAIEKEILGALQGKMPSLDAIATKFCMSPSTLKRNFKKVFGTSIYEYYLQKKMEFAQEMIETTRKTIKEIAYDLGYESVSHFIFIYKKFFGNSPAKTVKKLVVPPFCIYMLDSIVFQYLC